MKAIFFIAMIASSSEAYDPFVAVVMGDLWSLRISLEVSPQLDQRNREGNTLMHIAANGGHAEIVKFLLDLGASHDLPNNSQDVPMHIAACHGHTEVVRLLLDHGAGQNIPDINGHTPLLLAVMRNRKDVVKLLIIRGADPNEGDIRGRTALHEGVVHTHVEIVNFLLLAGADPNKRDKRDWTPLHRAAFHNQPEHVKVLLANGGDPKIVNKDGKTPEGLSQGVTKDVFFKFFKLNRSTKTYKARIQKVFKITDRYRLYQDFIDELPAERAMSGVPDEIWSNIGYFLTLRDCISLSLVRRQIIKPLMPLIWEKIPVHIIIGCLKRHEPHHLPKLKALEEV